MELKWYLCGPLICPMWRQSNKSTKPFSLQIIWTICSLAKWLFHIFIFFFKYMQDALCLISLYSFTNLTHNQVLFPHSFYLTVFQMRQQKDVFGQSCSLFLSDYIWTYSGFGPLKAGIRRLCGISCSTLVIIVKRIVQSQYLLFCPTLVLHLNSS